MKKSRLKQEKRQNIQIHKNRIPNSTKLDKIKKNLIISTI